jgi:hypothetical protein
LPTGTSQYPAYRTSTVLSLKETKIAGMGEITDTSCQALVFGRSIICQVNPNHSRLVFGGSTCKQPACPVCYTSWAFRGARRITERVEGFSKFDRYRPKHIILGADPEDMDIEALGDMTPKKAIGKLRAYFIQRAGDIGLKGGALVIHTHRIKPEIVPLIPLDVKRWSWVRKQGPGNFHNLTDFSPHCHILGYGYTLPILPGSDKFLYRSRGRLQTTDDLERAAYYALSHAPVIPGCKSVIYFGTLSYNKLKCKKIGSHYETVNCPDCGAPMIDEMSSLPVYRHVDDLEWHIVQSWDKEDKPAAGPPGTCQQ